MAKIHTLTYNGTKSSDLGVFVSGSGSFDAAEFDVDKYEIPGRNGDLILSNNRYKNIEITYPAFIPQAFMDKVQNVRNWLRSSRVYARLEDTYDMDHYRLGIPTGVQSFSPENRNDGANFEMTFDCKPQRFLKVGETPETVEADVQTETGEIVTFETVAESPITSASVALSPIQSLNGYDSPWPAGGGKNLFYFNSNPIIWTNGLTYTIVNENEVKITGTASAQSDAYFWWYNNGGPGFYLKNGTYRITVEGAGGNGGPYILYSGAGNNGVTYNKLTNAVPSQTITVTDDTKPFNYFVIRTDAGTTVDTTIKIQIESGSTATAWSPYSNICPISGHMGAELNIAAEYESEDATTYSVTFTDQGTVYGGTYDFVSGKLTVTWAAHQLSASEGDTATIGGAFCRRIQIADTKQAGARESYICSHFRKPSGAISSSPENGVASNIYWNTNNITMRDDALTTREEWDAYTTAQANAGTPITIAYELATPLEYTLSPQQLTTLFGQNVVWGNGTITLTYAEPYNIDNPTLFDARPLFTVTNPAEGDVIMVNGQAITFVDGYTGTAYIDCETMNAFSGAANLNSIIQATDFPVLVPGTNLVTWTGAGECTMTPRWWEL